MQPDELNLIWYNIDRLFQELEIKCEMVENAIDMLQNYKDSMEKTAELMRHNLALLSKRIVGHEQGNNTQRSEEEM